MRFKIESSSIGYDGNKIIEHYPFLKDFGFEIEKKTYTAFETIRDDEGKSLKQEYEKPIYTPYVYIYGLEELKHIVEHTEVPLIIDWDEGQGIIEIYDGWRE